MSLLANLRNGTYGIQFHPPPVFALEIDEETFASFRDEEHRVDWYLEFSPLIVDLSPNQDDVLREDLRIETTAVFESCFESGRQRQDSSVGVQGKDITESCGLSDDCLFSVPRTKQDPAWSPVVSVARVTFAGVPALQVIYRMAYAPGNEIIIGRIVIPLEQGTVYVSALRRANMTGARESALTITRLQSSPVDTPQHLNISQAEIDDPSLDDSFPDHPLRVIRRALSWMLTTTLHVTVTAPLLLQREELVELPNSGCAIRLPPRFRFCPRMAETMDRSLTPFVRATVPQSGSYTFDIWRVPSVTLKGTQALQQLRGLAEDHVRGWTHEGGVDVEVESVELPLFDGRPILRTFVRFRVNGHPNHAVASWFIDHDGTVFRVCAAGTESRSREELMAAVDESTLSWKRLPDDLKPRAKWWNVFSHSRSA